MRARRSRWRPRAWLGTGYQVTSQVNCVNPGGEAQSAHRDYHMGFQSAEEIVRFPLHAHQLSPVLTLQGAVAHCDMPVESGPTLYLPFSQRYAPGYLAWRKTEFIDYFDAHYVQLPLAKGDAAFFNPALFHAAGSNRTRDVRRIANLLADLFSLWPGDGIGRPGKNGQGALSRVALRPHPRSARIGQCHCRQRRGLRVPHQPRPRPAARRPRPAEPGGADEDVRSPKAGTMPFSHKRWMSTLGDG